MTATARRTLQCFALPWHLVHPEVEHELRVSTITRSSLADQHARGGGFRRSDAPGLLDGPIDGKAFLAFLDQVVVPTGDIVEMNNLACPHVEGVCDGWRRGLVR
jgi:hypothetical protein